MRQKCLYLAHEAATSTLNQIYLQQSFKTFQNMQAADEIFGRFICSHNILMLPGERYRVGNEDTVDDQLVSTDLGKQVRNLNPKQIIKYTDMSLRKSDNDK